MSNKYKLTYIHRDDGMWTKSHTVIEAESEEEACDIFEEEHEPYLDGFNGLEDCVEVIDTPLFKKALFVNMPDGYCYAVPVEVIARNRAKNYLHIFGGDFTRSLKEGTIPLFLNDESKIKIWAEFSMDWSDVKDKAIRLKEKVPEKSFEEVWSNSDKTIKEFFK